jgi:hypothetical protein
MVEKAAGFSHAIPPFGQDGRRTEHDSKTDLSVSPGNWGSPPGLTQASPVAAGTLSPKQKAAGEAEVEAQKAFLEFQAAKGALADIDPNDTAALSAAIKRVAELQDRAIDKAMFNVKCQKSAGNEDPFAEIFGNRFGDSYGLARAEILVQRAEETKIGLAYTARENVLLARDQLTYAQQWLAKEPGNAAARAEVARCQQACLTAAVKNTVAWGMAIGAEYKIGKDVEAHYGRNPAVYDTPQIKECKAGEADAKKMEDAIQAEIDGNAAVKA